MGTWVLLDFRSGLDGSSGLGRSEAEEEQKENIVKFFWLIRVELNRHRANVYDKLTNYRSFYNYNCDDSYTTITNYNTNIFNITI